MLKVGCGIAGRLQLTLIYTGLDSFSAVDIAVSICSCASSRLFTTAFKSIIIIIIMYGRKHFNPIDIVVSVQINHQTIQKETAKNHEKREGARSTKKTKKKKHEKREGDRSTKKKRKRKLISTCEELN